LKGVTGERVDHAFKENDRAATLRIVPRNDHPKEERVFDKLLRSLGAKNRCALVLGHRTFAELLREGNNNARGKTLLDVQYSPPEEVSPCQVEAIQKTAALLHEATELRLARGTIECLQRTRLGSVRLVVQNGGAVPGVIAALQKDAGSTELQPRALAQ
jgi:hypothetical protein